jgi:hypothetical protein
MIGKDTMEKFINHLTTARAEIEMAMELLGPGELTPAVNKAEENLSRSFCEIGEVMESIGEVGNAKKS